MSAWVTIVMRWAVVILLGWQVWLMNGAGVGDDTGAGASFEEANRQYEVGDYPAAIAAYEQLLGDRRGSAAVHFNLGNAWFKSGEIGRAIWHYRVARELEPRDADIRANLRFARNLVGGAATENRLERWVGLLTVDEWTTVVAVFFWIWAAGMIVRQLKARIWRSVRIWVRLSFLAWLAAALSLGIELLGQFGKTTAIVVRDVEVRYGPFPESQRNFQARDGAELNVVDRREGWVQVEDPRRGIGWIDQSAVLLHPGEGN